MRSKKPTADPASPCVSVGVAVRPPAAVRWRLVPEVCWVSLVQARYMLASSAFMSLSPCPSERRKPVSKTSINTLTDTSQYHVEVSHLCDRPRSSTGS